MRFTTGNARCTFTPFTGRSSTNFDLGGLKHADDPVIAAERAGCAPAVAADQSSVNPVGLPAGLPLTIRCDVRRDVGRVSPSPRRCRGHIASPDSRGRFVTHTSRPRLSPIPVGDAPPSGRKPQPLPRP